MDYPIGSLQPFKEIYHCQDIPFDACSFGDIEELPFFLALIAHTMEVSMHSSVIYLLNSLSPQGRYLSVGSIGPFSYDVSFRRPWMTVTDDVETQYRRIFYFTSHFLQLYRCFGYNSMEFGRSSRYFFFPSFTSYTSSMHLACVS